jgi:hypothetical protein
MAASKTAIEVAMQDYLASKHSRFYVETELLRGVPVRGLLCIVDESVVEITIRAVRLKGKARVDLRGVAEANIIAAIKRGVDEAIDDVRRKMAAAGKVHDYSAHTGVECEHCGVTAKIDMVVLDNGRSYIGQLPHGWLVLSRVAYEDAEHHTYNNWSSPIGVIQPRGHFCCRAHLDEHEKQTHERDVSRVREAIQKKIAASQA